MRGQNVKGCHAFFDILPCVVITSLDTDAFMTIIASIDMLMVRKNPAREVEK